MLVSFHQIPCPGKTNPLGEDSFYISPKKDCIGVFDGVGGWSKEYGVDARAYSNKLSDGVKIAFEEKKIRDPLELCHFAWEGAKEIPGTSTACVAILDGTKLKVGNVGDSGTLILRKEKTFFRTKEQQVEFNMPYQIGTGSDLTPKTHGELTEVQLQHGDWIVMSSDGLFDNLEVTDIIKVLRKSSAEGAAKDLADKTFKLSQDKHHHSPFAKDAKKNGLKWTGGKPDDITVIVALIQDPNGATSSSLSSSGSSTKSDKGKGKKTK